MGTARNDKDATEAADIGAELDVVEVAARLRVSIARLARLLRQLNPGDLSPTQIASMATIDRLGSITLGDLAVSERVAKPTITAVVGKLEEHGFVRRLEDPIDGRICRAELTDTGRDYLLESRLRRTAWLVDQLIHRSPSEIAVLREAVELLDRLSEPSEVRS